ncbi:hypothetical protein BVX97_03310 [bacterium E08(2017)]|nr:hypothetical protein BVX97_03310 [bacterium E08(2017)]
MTLTQTPHPEAIVLMHRGDLIEFKLEMSEPHAGSAFLRTNIGNAATTRREIINSVEEGEPILAKDWHDIEMTKSSESSFTLTLPLLETGSFEAKVVFLPENSNTPLWPEGDNTIVKVEPADTVCANNIYTAFVRQFGPNKKSVSNDASEMVAELDEKKFTVIPKSGTFRDLIKELDFILDELNFRFIHLLPVHPIPTTYARMGRFGSPFAVLNYFDVDSGMAEFDRETTPLEQFLELVDEAHKRNGRIMLDIPINHTGWASQLQIDHPEWFKRNQDNTFQSPGAWGTTWEDLSELDYSHKSLWIYMAEIFLFWCGHGVDAFRCDAGYKVPVPVWKYIVAKVRDQYPDTIFLLEGLGGKISTMETLLIEADLNWAYSELFQNYNRDEVSNYISHSSDISLNKGMLVNFAETHDNLRLAATSKNYAMARTSLNALCSHNGSFGITNGVEWLAQDRVDVHRAESINWGAKDNIVDHIKRLNHIITSHPSFRPHTNVRPIQTSTDQNCVAILRDTPDASHKLLVLVNLNHDRPGSVSWNKPDFPVDSDDTFDLLSEKSVSIETKKNEASCKLEPGQAICLSTESDCPKPNIDPNDLQEITATALMVHTWHSRECDLNSIPKEQLAEELIREPMVFFQKVAADSGCSFPKITTWKWPRDTRRTVMVPANHFIYIESPHPFMLNVSSNNEALHHCRSIPCSGGRFFRILPPFTNGTHETHCTISMTVFNDNGISHDTVPILPLPAASEHQVLTSFSREQAEDRQSYAICTNGRGAMSHVRSAWSELESRYDCLLGANLDDNQPVDRRILFTRCRAWFVRHGYSQEINKDCMLSFSQSPDGTVKWDFSVPVGKGDLAELSISLRMIKGKNAVTLTFERSNGPSSSVIGHEPVQLILRPDIENRSFHTVTKAFAGAEQTWSDLISTYEKGFHFNHPGDCCLQMQVSEGSYNHEPDWTYMVGYHHDAERGMDDANDLYSPGYFAIDMRDGTKVTLTAEALREHPGQLTAPGTAETLSVISTQTASIAGCSRNAIDDFIVARDELKTVIAGYPWFLDWGRDTLICLRGMISAGMIDESIDILKAFARFEKSGTIPNMLNGADDSNRETSDAPLWLFVACSDLIKAASDSSILNADCGGRPLIDILKSIADHYISGTPNGIKVDEDSGLVYSPSHYTWMDTNHPAGTPREGYPVEIQALWHFALSFLAEHRNGGKYKNLRKQVRDSIAECFYAPPSGSSSLGLCDCLHTKGYQPVSKATPDDALRSNQLLAITLGAIQDQSIRAEILRACEELLVPGAIRSLADRPTSFAFPVMRDNVLINDPNNPYWGHYTGDEDTRRKPAYHNGTAWSWPFPSYSEALLMTYGDDAKPTAEAILGSSLQLLNSGCIRHIPEIIDGNHPHISRGCGAQAWGATELLRVANLLM